MDRRLVDSSKAFRAVYSAYQHEYLGCIVSAHVVQELDNGRLSLLHQALLQGNMTQFESKLDETDRKLVSMLNKITPYEIVKKFGSTSKNTSDFFLNKFKDEIQKTVSRFINRTVSEALPLLRDRELFIMGNDGYPAKDRAEVLDEKAAIRFAFTRDDRETRYYPLIYLNGQRLSLYKSNSEVLVEDPAWVLLNGQVFTFDQVVDGKKLRPFLRKPFIAIPKTSEDNYFRKFAPQIIAAYDVDASGLKINYVRKDPKFRLVVDGSQPHAIEMEIRVEYGAFDMKPAPGMDVEVQVEQKGEAYIFYKIYRNPEAERDVVNYIEQLAGGNGLFSFGMMERQAGLQWLSKHVPLIVQNGIEVVQDGELQTLNFEKPEIVLEPVDAGDWFDIKAMVHIAGHKIPFIRFRKHILSGKRDFVLPDGSVAILPEEWFSDYRHLLEIAEERDGETIAIKKYQAVVLDFPAAGAGQLKEKVSSLAKVKEVQEVGLPKGLKAELRSYQQQGYNWMSFLQEFSFGGILADDMGLGKTLQTLSLLQMEKEKEVGQPSLVILPTSLVHNWVAEAGKFTPQLRILVHTGSQRNTDLRFFPKYDVIITTYGLVRQDLEMLQQFPFHYLILDESQMIKNPGSKTAKAVKDLKARFRLSLTGTPVENTLMDLWSQMTFLNPGLLGSERFFRDFYITPIEKFGDEKRTEKLKRLIHPFILRRTKVQVATELPEKVEQVHYCEMTDAQQQLYDETKNSYRNYLLGMDEGEFKRSKLNILAGLQKLRQIAIHPGLVEEGIENGLEESGKFQEYARLLDEVISKGSKVLVFSQFVRLLKLFRADLEKRGISYCYLDGGTSDRQKEVERFQNNTDIQVFLISLKAGGVGLNLTAADYVFILDPWWNPAVENQAIDRSHRIGQKNTVFSYKFITKDTIEEKIIKLQQRKFQLSQDVISVEKELFKKLDMADFQELLV